MAVCPDGWGQGPALGLGGGEGLPRGVVSAGPELVRGAGERSHLGGGEVVGCVGPSRGLRSGGSHSIIDVLRVLRKF